MIPELPITQREQDLASLPIVCFGEALVDLVCERPVERLTEVDSFTPHTGGALANVATVAALAGANVALAGGAGNDAWGRWLQEQLTLVGVDLHWWALHDDTRTPIAFVTINERHEPSFLIYGRDLGRLLSHLDGQITQLVTQASCLVVGSNTLTSEDERLLTEEACQLAADSKVPIVFDPNLRPDRWKSVDDALPHCLQLLAKSNLVKLSEEECLWLSDTDDVAAGAAALSSERPGVVLTRGENGADLFVDGVRQAHAACPPVSTVDTTGAGDVLLGYLLSEFDGTADSIERTLPRAVDLAARSTTYFGATTGLAELL